MRLFIAFTMVIVPNSNCNILGIAMFLCAWAIYDRIDSKNGDIQSELDGIKRRLNDIKKQLEEKK